jgi:hypothetical protein
VHILAAQQIRIGYKPFDIDMLLRAIDKAMIGLPVALTDN